MTESGTEKNFIDNTWVFLKAGDGGDGCMSFRREKFVPKGGPNGGNGGKGGDILFVSNRNLTTLLHLARNPHIKAPNGANGAGSLKDGRAAKSITVFVPCGTIVKEDGHIIADLQNHEQQFLAALGGKGGRGNNSFKTQSNTAPRISEKGERGKERTFELELKVLSDIGLIGFPNAGKSSFLSMVSSAKPKIAGYPFTTLNPNLAIVSHKNKSFAAADIPGLIEGAHSGKGLGHKFLRHIERTRILIHIIDPLGFDSITPLQSVDIISRELKRFNKDLAKNRKILVVNKSDLPESKKAYEQIKRKYKKNEVFLISAATGEGINALLDEIIKQLSLNPLKIKKAGKKTTEIKLHKLEPAFTINRISENVIELTGTEIIRRIEKTNFEQPQSMLRLKSIFKKIGLEKALRKEHITHGTIIRSAGIEFLWEDELYSVNKVRRISRRKRKP